MIFTLNYGDLQDINKKLISKKITSDKQVFDYIDSYKETINYMYKNNLIKDKSKADLELELQDFAKKILANTKETYKDLEKTYGTKSITINTNTIKLNL